jgi:hypothetical protein
MHFQTDDARVFVKRYALPLNKEFEILYSMLTGHTASLIDAYIKIEGYYASVSEIGDYLTPINFDTLEPDNVEIAAAVIVDRKKDIVTKKIIVPDRDYRTAKIVEEYKYGAIHVSGDVKEFDTVNIVEVEYTTGNSLGVEDNQFEAVYAFSTPKEAFDLQQALIKHFMSEPRTYGKNNELAHITHTIDGKDVKIDTYMYIGYFEEVVRVTMAPYTVIPEGAHNGEISH